MKKGIFAMFILLSSMAMVACTSTSTSNEGAEENDAFKVLEKRREYYKVQDKERAKMEAEEKKAEEQTTTEEVTTAVDEEDTKAQEEAMKEAAKAKAEAEKEALKVLEKMRKGN